jgi:hypothetical protein
VNRFGYARLTRRSAKTSMARCLSAAAKKLDLHHLMNKKALRAMGTDTVRYKK